MSAYKKDGTLKTKTLNKIEARLAGGWEQIDESDPEEVVAFTVDRKTLCRLLRDIEMLLDSHELLVSYRADTEAVKLPDPFLGVYDYDPFTVTFGEWINGPLC